MRRIARLAAAAALVAAAVTGVAVLAPAHQADTRTSVESGDVGWGFAPAATLSPPPPTPQGDVGWG